MAGSRILLRDSVQILLLCVAFRVGRSRAVQYMVMVRISALFGSLVQLTANSRYAAFPVVS